MNVLTTNSAEETRQVGVLLGRLFEPGDILCMYGDLGAGKTALSQGVALGLNVNEHVTSPTFTLINEYQGRIPLYHMDVYRLGGPDEMDDLGYEEYFYGDGVTLVEWANLVKEALPAERLDLQIIKRGDNERLLRFIPWGKRYNILVEELLKLVRAGD